MKISREGEERGGLRIRRDQFEHRSQGRRRQVSKDGT